MNLNSLSAIIIRTGSNSDRATRRLFRLPSRFAALVAAALLTPCRTIADQAVTIIEGGTIHSQRKVDAVTATDSAAGLFASADAATGVIKASANWDGRGLAGGFYRADAGFTVDGLTVVAPPGVAGIPIVLHVDALLGGSFGTLFKQFHNRVVVSIDLIGQDSGEASVDFTYEKSQLEEIKDVFPLASGSAGYSVLSATPSNFNAVVRASVVPGRTYELTCRLIVEAAGLSGCPAFTDASHTATISIDLPAGCLLKTTSGKFLSAQTPGASGDSRLINLSVRSPAGSGDRTLITGFVIGGSGSRRILVRGIGPALAPLGVSGALTDPRLLLFSGAGGGAPIQENSGWGGGAPLASMFAAVGAFALPATSKDTALLSTLPTGLYTAHVTSNVGTGIALTEAYDADSAAGGARLVNVSARTQVGTGDDVLITGFVIGGTGLKTVLIRGVGPSLTPFGVSGALGNPQLRLFNGNTLLTQNDDWGGGAALSSAFSATGAFPLPGNSRDAALIATLSPGAYTAQVSGVGGTTGIALVEVYEMP